MTNNCVKELVGFINVQGDKKTGTFEMRSGSHVQLATLRNKDLELQTTSPVSTTDQWNGQQRAVAIHFFNFCWGFQKFPFFCVTLYFRFTLTCFGKWLP
jgi:hypothetical protein